jgi:hypothetical protein
VRRIILNNENVYDGCEIASSELLKKNFEGFKQGEVVINHLKGTWIPFDIEKYMKETGVDM